MERLRRRRENPSLQIEGLLPIPRRETDAPHDTAMQKRTRRNFSLMPLNIAPSPPHITSYSPPVDKPLLPYAVLEMIQNIRRLNTKYLVSTNLVGGFSNTHILHDHRPGGRQYAHTTRPGEAVPTPVPPIRTVYITAPSPTDEGALRPHSGRQNGNQHCAKM